MHKQNTDDCEYIGRSYVTPKPNSSSVLKVQPKSVQPQLASIRAYLDSHHRKKIPTSTVEVVDVEDDVDGNQSERSK